MAHEGVQPKAAGGRPVFERNIAQRFGRLKARLLEQPETFSAEARGLPSILGYRWSELGWCLLVHVLEVVLPELQDPRDVLRAVDAREEASFR